MARLTECACIVHTCVVCLCMYVYVYVCLFVSAVCAQACYAHARLQLSFARLHNPHSCRRWHIQATCARSGEGLLEAFSWLAERCRENEKVGLASVLYEGWWWDCVYLLFGEPCINGFWLFFLFFWVRSMHARKYNIINIRGTSRRKGDGYLFSMLM